MKKFFYALATATLLLTPEVALAQCTGQFNQNQVCGYAGAGKGLPGPIAITPGVLNPIPGGTVLGNPTTTTVVPVATTAPVLGIAGTSTGRISFTGNVSGTVTVIAQSIAGTPTLTLPNTSGTLVSNTTSFFSIDSASGQLSVVGILPLANGGTNAALTASNGGIFYSTASAGAILAGTATARQMLQSGASAAPAWSTATWPATTAAGTILTSGTANTVMASSTPTLGASGTLGSLTFGNATSGLVTIQPVAGALGTVTVLLPAASGTAAVSASSPLVLSATTGALTCPTCATSSTPSGAALTAGNDTNVTLTLGGSPTTALLNAASVTAGWTGQLSLTRGGTNASLTASNGGLIYSTGSALAILSGTATANQIPLSGSSAAPSWSTATYPNTTAAGTLLASNSANVIAATATPTLGANGGTGGQVTLNGATSGSVVLRVAAAAGTGTVFQLPANNGTNTYVLQTDGSGNTSWVPSVGGGTVTSITCSATLSCTATNPITTTGTIAINLSNANTWAATQTFGTINVTTFQSGGNTMTFPGNAATITQTVASGSKALATTAVASGACSSAQTDTATGATTSDAPSFTFASDPTSVTGYTPSTNGMLTIIPWVTANTINFKVCNNTASSITPGSISINWRVTR